VEALAAACDKNLWQSLDAPGWVRDAVVEDDDGSRSEILCYEPADVPDEEIGDSRDVFCYFVRLAIDQTCLTLTSSTGILSLMNSWDRLVAVRCS
jgi:hypothetical protein